MEPEEKQEIVDAVIAQIASESINAQLGFSVDEDGYLCVDTEIVTTT
jgi:hypothetical protein